MKELYQFYMHSCAKAGEGTKLIKDSTQADEAVLERFDIGCCEDEPDFTPPPLDRHQYFFAMVSYRHLSELIDRSFGTVMLAVTQEKTCVIVVSGLQLFDLCTEEEVGWFRRCLRSAYSFTVTCEKDGLDLEFRLDLASEERRQVSWDLPAPPEFG